MHYLNNRYKRLALESVERSNQLVQRVYGSYYTAAELQQRARRHDDLP